MVRVASGDIGILAAIAARDAGNSNPSVNDLAIAIAVALAESNGNAGAIHVNTGDRKADGPTRDVGLWQINTYYHPQYAENWLLDPQNNAKAAYQVSKGFKDWTPWKVFTSGAYMTHMVTGRLVAQGTLSKPIPEKWDPNYSSGEAIPGAKPSLPNPFDEIAAFIRFIASPANWRRMGLAALGILILFIGLARVGFSSNVSRALPIAKALRK